MVALDVATGKVVGQTVQRHGSEEFLAFLDHPGRGIKPDADMRVILDNVSRANAVEGFFSNKLSRQRLRNAVFNLRQECIAAIEGCIEHHDANDVQLFRCSRKPEELVASWKRGRRKPQKSV